ncbi:nuclear transport factor 2 family protein [Azospira sp. I13]|uniref:nuclear transport factor 2 family protein n=1 Tax=Azospira sp. I13 TaxID=1765050 RepID=UPI000D58DCD8|nr:nuclear transport factor 2 family protein [Azospira sp. I13]
MTALHSDRHREIQALFENYIEMYASRDDRLTTHFSENFSGYTGSGNFLVRSREEWIRITRQDFAQVTGRIRIEMLDLELQDISDDVVVSTAFFHIHLPTENQVLSSEVARLVLIFRREGEGWKIVHSGISIPYHPTQDGEVYPLKSLREQNAALMALVEERTRALNESESLYRQLTEDTQDVIWKADANLCIAYISPADERLRGFKAEEVIGRHVFEMFNDEGIAAVKALMQQRAVAEQSGPLLGCLTFEAEHRCKDGSWLWGEVQSNPVRDAHGVIIGYHGITREITQRKRLEEQVQQLAFHDPLTGLANRRLLLDRLTQNIFSTQRTRRYSALAFLDLDHVLCNPIQCCV